MEKKNPEKMTFKKVILFSFRNYTGPQKSAGEGKGSSRVTYSKASKAYNPAIEVDDDSHSKYMSDSKRYQAYERDIEDSEVSFIQVLI